MCNAFSNHIPSHGSSAEGAAAERARLPEPALGVKVATLPRVFLAFTGKLFSKSGRVNEVISGYCGGKDPDPFYDNVKPATLGMPKVQVYYDSTKYPTKPLGRPSSPARPPTSLNRRGQDEGTEYRSMAFYRNEAEKKFLNQRLKTECEPQIQQANCYQINPFQQFSGRTMASGIRKTMLITIMWNTLPFRVLYLKTSFRKVRQPADCFQSGIEGPPRQLTATIGFTYIEKAEILWPDPFISVQVQER